MTEGTHSRPTIFSELSQVHTAVLRSKVILLDSSSFQAKALCSSCCLCMSVVPFLDGLMNFDPLGCGRMDSGYKLDAETTLHELLVHLWVVNGKACHCGIVVGKGAQFTLS